MREMLRNVLIYLPIRCFQRCADKFRDGAGRGPLDRSGSPLRQAHARTRSCLAAVVSLCRVHDDDVSVGVEQIDVRLIDDVGPAANPNLDFVLVDTVRLIERLRDEGRTVLVHCVAAQSRTPILGALLGARKRASAVKRRCGK